MAEVRTLTQLQEVLDADMGWRIKEIADLKQAATSRKVFVRAGIAMVYAHWEGFIKNASTAYLSYVETRKHVYRELNSCFAVFGLKSKLDLLSSSRQAKANIEAFDFVLSKLDTVARMSIIPAVDTESNLTSVVFSNIAASINVNTTSYTTKYKLIDESLVNRRNKVAHGEYLDVNANEFRRLADEILDLMRHYKTDIENAASQKSYLRTLSTSK